jgi:hypothetical protein
MSKVLLASSVIEHDNAYRALEIYQDEATDEGIELDEIDLRHKIATSSPKLKSRSMHVPGDTAHFGLPNYTLAVQEDMERMLQFLQAELNRSVVREFLDRSRLQTNNSFMKLQAVHSRYLETGVNLASFSQGLPAAHPTHVPGIYTGANATKREIVETQHIVRGLLHTPDLLHKPSPFHDRIRQIRGGGYRHGESGKGLQERKHTDINLKEAQYAEGDIYNSKGGTWDGTVYKRTLLQSLRRKLAYKLYFDALRHHTLAIRSARMAVVSISARRMSKKYKLCFQALLTEFLVAQHTQSLAEMRARAAELKSFILPATKLLRGNALAMKCHRASLVKAQRGHQLFQYAFLCARLWEFCRTGKRRHAAVSLAVYTANSRLKRNALRIVREHRRRQRTIRRHKNALIEHLVEWELHAPLRGILIICAVRRRLSRCNSKADSHLLRRRYFSAFSALRTCAQRRWRRMRARLLSLVHDKEKVRPLTYWESKMLRSRRLRRSATRADMLFRELNLRSTMEFWGGRALYGRYEERRQRAADCHSWSRSASEGLNAFRTNAILTTTARSAAERSQTFYRFNVNGAAIFSWVARAKAGRRGKLLMALSADAKRLHALLDAMAALKGLWAQRKRRSALRQWAKERALRICIARAQAAWTLAYVRKSTLRLALEKRIARDAYARASGQGALAQSSGEDAKRLEQGLLQLRAEALIRLGGVANVDAPQLYMYLETLRRSIPVSKAARRDLQAQYRQLKADKERDETKVQTSSLNDLTASSASAKSPVSSRAQSPMRASKATYQTRRDLDVTKKQVFDSPAHSMKSMKLAVSEDCARYDDASDSSDDNESERAANSPPPTSKLDVPWSTKRAVRPHAYRSNEETERKLLSGSFTTMMTEANQQNASSLYTYFKRAHSVERARAPPPKSDYLAVARPNTHVSILSASDILSETLIELTPSRATPFSSARQSRTRQLSPVRMQTGDAENNARSDSSASKATHTLQQALSSAGEVNSALSAGLLERSIEIASNWGGFKHHSFIFGDSGDNVDEEDAWDAEAETELADKDKSERTSMAGPLDSAMLLLRAARWSIQRLQRHAHLRIAARRVASLTRKMRLRRAQAAWGHTYKKFSQALALSHCIWVEKARRKAVRHFVYFAVTRLRALETRTREKLTQVRSAIIFRAWRREYLLHRAERRTRRLVRLKTIARCVHAWEWSRRHVPSIVKFQTKRRRRLLYPAISLWRTKAQKLHKLRIVFQGFEKACAERWAIQYLRSDTARMFECYDAWISYVKIEKAEKHAKNQMERAVLFRCASLTARCFVGWLDFHLACLKVKRNLVKRRRAQLAKHHMVQRVFIHAISEIAAGMRARFNRAAAHEKAHILTMCFRPWAATAKLHFVSRPVAYHSVRMLRTAWNVLRVQRRERLMHTVLIPFQMMRRKRRCLLGWHRIFTRKIRMIEGGSKLMHALMQMQVRKAVQLWPGRESFRKAEAMRTVLDTRGRAKIVLVDNKPKDTNPDRERQLALKEKEARDRSFIQMRQSAPVQRRAALLGFIYSADDPDAVRSLFDLLRAVLYAWADQSHTDASLRGMERLVRFRHKRAVIEQSLRIWISRCSATSHRMALWISKKSAKQAHRKLTISSTAMATEHLIKQYAKLGLSDMLTIESPASA